MPSKDPIDKLSWEVSPREAVKKIQFLITTNHATIPQLADAIGVQQSALQDVVDGLSFPTEAMIRRCAKHFGVKASFITGEEEPRDERPGSSSARKGGSRGSKPGSSASRNSLNVRTVATRHQALVELLIEKGVIQTREYQEKVAQVEGRQR